MELTPSAARSRQQGLAGVSTEGVPSPPRQVWSIHQRSWEGRLGGVLLEGRPAVVLLEGRHGVGQQEGMVVLATEQSIIEKEGRRQVFSIDFFPGCITLHLSP